jgi:hypothetical protein
MKIRFLAAAAMALLLAACDMMPAGDVTSAERVETSTAVGTIREVDRVNRRVVLRIDGRTLTLRANEAVPAFDIVEVGDRVRVTYTEAVAVDMALPDDTGERETVAGGGLFVDAGTIGRVEGGVTSAVYEVVSFDRGSNKATLITPEGDTVVVDVAPELRDFARSRVPGDRVLITLAIGTAIELELAETG